MSICFFDATKNCILIHSIFYFYGDAATLDLSKTIAGDIARYWNEANAYTVFNRMDLPIQFNIEGYYHPNIDPLEVVENTNPLNNYFRIEDYSYYDHSFVDDLNSNTGYFVTADLNHTGSTAAHEYGHTLGLAHPREMNIIGKGVPGIMYPRGSLVDPEYQYFPTAKPGEHGGTINPIHRIVTDVDIANLQLAKRLVSSKGRFILGDFTSVWHERHKR